MCMSILAEYMYVYHTQTWYLGRPQEDVGFPGSRVTDVCETPYAGNQTQILHKNKYFQPLSNLSSPQHFHSIPLCQGICICMCVPHVWMPVEVKVLEIPRNWTHSCELSDVGTGD